MTQPLPAHLIVNGDDFGVTSGVNRGILDAHRNGILTSASLLVDGAAAEEAASSARAEPRLSVGLHLALDDVSAHDAAVTAEVGRQLDRFERLTGRPPSHLDTHHHRHRDPSLLRPLRAAAAELGVPLRESTPIRHLPSFYGRWDGESHPEQISVDNLLAIVGDDLPEGVAELACHPGYVDDGLRSDYRHERELEIATLCDRRLRTELGRSGVRLVNFLEAHALIAGSGP